ncbi:TonB-dependent receptor [Compostibacter hankyongensis]|uniref:TonB-dependent receptor n=1 Tax=Compostibacter hankyongensis TaxID=1007089 RepID=A0ABP8G850_9BACT
MSPSAKGQNLTGHDKIILSGMVKNRAQQAVPFASLKIRGTDEGTTTDSLGRFSFSASASGEQTLVVSSIGFNTYTQPVNLQGKDITMQIVLQPRRQELQGVVISAGSFEASDKAKGASLTPMDAVTVAGSNNDLATALRSLPGAQQIGEQAGLFVRGGTGEETKQFIDGMLMPFPNYPSIPGLPQPARVDPFLFQGILFSSGGYSALYGEAMSSALILNSVDLPDRSSADFSAFLPGNLSAGFQKITGDKKGSYGISGSYNNQHLYNRIVPQEPDYFYGPEYYNGNANLGRKIGKTGMLKLYVSWDHGHTALRNPDVDSLSLKSAYTSKSRNLYAHVNYRQLLGDSWKISAGLAYDDNRDEVNTRLLDRDNQQVFLSHDPYRYKNSDFLTRSVFAQGRLVLTHMFGRNQSIDFGAEHFYTRDRFTHNDSLSALTDHLSAVFAEGNLQLSSHISARAGLRMEYSSLLGRTTWSPRLSLAYRISDGAQFNAAYGMFYQKPDNVYLFANRRLDFSRADHYVINFTRKADNRFFRIEAYYKQYHDLVKTDPAYDNNGKGYAKGIELFWRDKKTIPDLDYWVSYTYLDTKRDFLDYPYTLRPAFTSPHTATLAVKKFFPGISTSVNVSYAFAAGRPYYDIAEQPEGPARVRDEGHTRAYNVVNLHIAYLFNMFKKWKQPAFSGVALGANNLLGTRQVFGYNYSSNGLNKIPVTPPARRYYFIGFFTSFGVDRTSDFMDNMDSNL